MVQTNYLFCGEEDFLKDEKQSRVISQILEGRPALLNCDRHDAKDGAGDIFASLDTLPFLADRKVVVVDNIECLPETKKKTFLKYLKGPLKDVYLVLRTRQSPPKDKFIRAVSGLSKTFTFEPLKQWEAGAWIKKRLSERNMSFTDEALELILELKGGRDLPALSTELEKLITYKGRKKVVTEDDVSALVGKSLAKSAFRLVDAIASRNKESSLLILHDIISGSKKEAVELMGLIGWQFRKIWRAKELLTGGEKPRSVAVMLRIKSNSVQKFLDQVNSFKDSEIKEAFRLIAETDRRIKTGKQSPGYALEELIIALCG